MGVIINRKGRFATEGIRFQRHNGDGSIPTPQRFLGFHGTAAVSVPSGGEISIRIDHGEVQTRAVNLSGVVTVAEAVAALTSAAFDGIEWGVDGGTNRLRGTAAGDGKVIQIWGPMAAALDFGQSVRFGGDGLRMISFFGGETISIGLPKDIREREEIDKEGADGTITRMVIGAMLQGLSPVVTLKEKDYELLQLIQGGTLNRETGDYDPPLSHESDSPTFYAEVFSEIYGKGIHVKGNMAGYEKLLIRSMIGMEGEVPIGAKEWATYAFNLVATEYTDEFGKQWPAWRESTLTKERFDALRVKDISI